MLSQGTVYAGPPVEGRGDANIPSHKPLCNVFCCQYYTKDGPVHEPTLKVSLRCGPFGQRFVRGVRWVEEGAYQAVEKDVIL